MLHQFSRNELAIGTEGLQKLKNTTVAILGVGGVGSFAGLDMEWIFAAILFCMGIRFCFKIMYAMAKWIWKA